MKRLLIALAGLLILMPSLVLAQNIPGAAGAGGALVVAPSLTNPSQGGGSGIPPFPACSSGQIVGFNTLNTATCYTPFNDVVVDPNTYAFSVHHWFLTSTGDANDQLIDDLGGLISSEDILAEHDITNFSMPSSCEGINPKDPFYGALGDTTPGDDAGLQKAILAGEVVTNSTTMPVCIPAGNYSTNFPLIISDPHAVFPKIRGAGGISTVDQQTVIAPSAPFPAIVAVPSDYVTSMGTISVPAITGSGNALQITAGAPILNLAEVPMVGTGSVNNPNPLNGLSNVTIQFFIKPASTADQAIISSNDGYGIGHHSMHILYYGGQLYGEFNVGGVHEQTTGGGSLTAGHVYAIRLVLDSANSKIWLYKQDPGATAGAVASVSASGNIVQAVAESFLVGGIANNGWPFENVTLPYSGVIQSIDIENTALSTGGNWTAPTSNFTGGAGTLYLNNFTTIAPTKNGVTNTPVVSVDYLNGVAQSKAWQLLWNPVYDNNGRGMELGELGVNGGTLGLFVSMIPGSTIRNMNIVNSSYGGLEPYNNTYNSHLSNIYISPNTYAAFGYGSAWSVGEADSIVTSGSYYPIASSTVGIGKLNHPIETASSTTISGLRLGLGTSSFVENTIVDNESDIENGGNANGLELYETTGSSFMTAVGGSFTQAGTGVPILVEGNNQAGQLTLAGSILVPGASSAADISYTSSAFMTADLMGVTTTGATPLTNRPELVSNHVAGVDTIQSLVANAGTTAEHDVTNFTLNGVFNVKDPFYGAVGSATHSTATTNGTTTVTLSGVGDWKNGQHVTLAHASIVSSAGAPAFTVAPMSTDSNGFNTVSGCSTWNSITCGTTWRYEIFAIDANNGWTGPSSIQQTTVGPSTISPWDINRLTITTSANDVGYAIYRCTGAACTSWALTGAAIVTNAPLGGARPATILWDDFGSTVSVPVDSTLGTSPPAGNLNQDLHTTIVSGAGTTTLVVANTAVTTGPYEMVHDDAPAFQAAFDASKAHVGGKVQIPCPGEYHLGSTLNMVSVQGVIVQVDQQPGGATGCAIAWNGSIVGTEIFMDGSASNTIQNWTTFPLSSRGNSAGIVIDMDKINGSMATTSNQILGGRFYNATIGVRMGNVSATNDDLMTISDATFSQNYYSLYLNTTLGDRFYRDTFGSSAYGIYLASGSYSARDTNMGGNVVDFFVLYPNGPITIDGGTIDHGGYKNLKIDTPTAESGLIPLTFENMRIYNQNPSYDGSSTNDVIIADRSPAPLILTGNTWKQGSNLAQAANMKIVATQSSGVNTQVFATGNIYHNATPYSGSANINLTQCNESYANAGATLAVPIIEGCSTTNFIASGVVAETPCRSALSGNNMLTASCAHSFYTLNGSGTETLPAGTYDGQNWSLTFCATGAFTPTIGPATGANAVAWPAAGAPAFTATNNKCDEISGYWDATNSRWAMWPVALGRAIAP